MSRSAPPPAPDRRRFLRWLGLGLLLGGVGWLAARRPGGEPACSRRCQACSSLAGCALPWALAEKDRRRG